VLRKWVKDFTAAPSDAFPGHGQIKPEQLEIDRLRREVTRLKAERDILKRMACPVGKGFLRNGSRSASTYPVSGSCSQPRFTAARNSGSSSSAMRAFRPRTATRLDTTVGRLAVSQRTRNATSTSVTSSNARELRAIQISIPPEPCQTANLC
jgi:hypothetical protein